MVLQDASICVRGYVRASAAVNIRWGVGCGAHITHQSTILKLIQHLVSLLPAMLHFPHSYESEQYSIHDFTKTSRNEV